MTAPAPDAYARQNQVYHQLKRVMDPELGASIVKLGLIYDITIDGDDVTVVMTLTTQGCPMQNAITAGVERVVSELPWVACITTRVVWDPAWHAGMIR